METAKDLTEQLIFRAKNLQEFVVERDWALIPAGVVKFDIQHTVGESARILLPLPEHGANTIDFVFNAFLGDGHPYQEIELSLAGHRIVQRLAKPLGNKIEITIPKSVESVGYIELTIKVKKPISPKSLGLANDDRRLGIGLVSAVFK